MANNVNQKEIRACNSSYSEEEEENEVATFDENGNPVDIDQNICEDVSQVPLIERCVKRGKKKYNIF